MWNWDDGHMDEGWSAVMMLVMLGIWVALIGAIVFAVIWTVRSTRAPWTSSSPQSGGAGFGTGLTGGAEQILAERLARGEIDTEEYRTRLDALNLRRQP